MKTLLRDGLAVTMDAERRVSAVDLPRQEAVIVQLAVLERERRVECRTRQDAHEPDRDFVDLRPVGDGVDGERDETHEEIHHEGRDGAQEAHLLDAPEQPPLRERLFYFLLLRKFV